MDSTTLLQELGRPFSPAAISWLPGATSKSGDTCMAMAYADSRAYQDRLDEVLGLDWSVRYTQASAKSIVCELTIIVDGRTVTRSATGEDTDLMSAEARALKRACSAFNLGRYLYELPKLWVAYDGQRKRIADDAQAKLDQRYRDWYQRSTAQDAKGPMGPTEPTENVSTIVDKGTPQTTLAQPEPAQPHENIFKKVGRSTGEALPEPWHEDWTETKYYTAVMKWSRKSGKFEHERHFINAWGKLFAQHEAHKPENAADFLAAWYVYVQSHEPAQQANGKVTA